MNLSAPVSHVTLDPATRKATGIRLASGEWKGADIVVVNADLVYAHNNLFKVEGGSAPAPSLIEKVQEKVVEPLLNPKLAKKLLDKPHS